jgi:cellulose synthase/poly-beta-1,6-N-acetylglucosamine synthase-like glycosyltransferase
MITFLQIICLLCLYGMVHTYVVYPLFMYVVSRNAPIRESQQTQVHYAVSVLMAAYNEEAVIEAKLDNLLKLETRGIDLRIFIGSDASADQTEAIVSTYLAKHPNVSLDQFPNRRGKPSVLNDLAQRALEEVGNRPDHLFLITDANVFLDEDILQKLIPNFADPQIALTDSRMINTGTATEDISTSEAAYISLEGKLKQWESIAWQTMMGPFGGCYALRSTYYKPIPPHFLVDDFYIALQAFAAGGKCVNEPQALCYEAVSHDIKEEYRRKARISAGNFQNLARFKKLLLKPHTRLGFALISHKVLRWITPFLVILCWSTAAILALLGNFWFAGLFGMLTIGIIIIPLADLILSSFGLHILPLRHIRYFIRMNVALLQGFFRYLNGISGGVWEPTKRTNNHGTTDHRG